MIYFCRDGCQDINCIVIVEGEIMETSTSITEKYDPGIRMTLYKVDLLIKIRMLG